jgi:hypothetical protein
MSVLSSELAREKMWSRIYITPLLQAEEDRDQVRRYYADQAREKELFGSVSSPYNSDRYGSLSGLVWLRSICFRILMGFVWCRFVRPSITYSPSKVTRD